MFHVYQKYIKYQISMKKYFAKRINDFYSLTMSVNGYIIFIWQDPKYASGYSATSIVCNILQWQNGTKNWKKSTDVTPVE